MRSFINGYGTVLFFEDQAKINRLQEQYKTYAEKIFRFGRTNLLPFYNLWYGFSLEIEGFGASLQHYNPLIDDEVRKTWDISRDWKLIAQLPLENPLQNLAIKTSHHLKNV